MFYSIITEGITVSNFIICTAVSLTLGMGTALLCMFKSRYTQSFVVTLSMLPAVVQLVIMLVNGNIGAGLAVAGAFTLVRFRSAAGTAKEIGMIFLSMAIGLATGMGYIWLAIAFFVILGVFFCLLTICKFGAGKANERMLKITVSENMDYDTLFDDIFKKYALTTELDRIKVSNMGTLYELHYRIVLKGEKVPKEFLDELRCRNGNLNIVCGRIADKESL